MEVFEIQETDLIRVRNELRLRGETVHDWAIRHGFTAKQVYPVLGGTSRALRGQSFKIAKALGLIPEPPSTHTMLAPSVSAQTIATTTPSSTDAKPHDGAAALAGGMT